MTVTGTSSGYTNPTGTTIPCVTFQGATVNGNVLNAGTITPGSPSGIVVDNASTINGTITNSGQISIGGAPAIAIHGLVTGGLNNSGTLAGVQTIFIDGVIGNATTFLGGITNSGTISAIGLDAILFSVPTFTGGISNGGTISGVAGWHRLYVRPEPGHRGACRVGRDHQQRHDLGERPGCDPPRRRENCG